MMSGSQSQDVLKDPSAHTIVAGDLEAVFLPGHGMLGASLSHRNVEILRRIEDLQAAAAKGSTAGIPLLHPWANRLAGSQYRDARRALVAALLEGDRSERRRPRGPARMDQQRPPCNLPLPSPA